MDSDVNLPDVNLTKGQMEVSNTQRIPGLISAAAGVLYAAIILALRFYYSKDLIFTALDTRLGYQIVAFLIGGVLVTIFAVTYLNNANTVLLRIGAAMTALGYLLTFLGGVLWINFGALFEQGYVFEDILFLAFDLACLGAGVFLSLAAIFKYGFEGQGGKAFRLGLIIFAGVIFFFDAYWFVDLMRYLIKSNAFSELGSMQVYFVVEAMMLLRFIFVLPYVFLAPNMKKTE